MEKEYGEGDDARREAAVLADIMDACLPESAGKRPSVETLLHHLCPGAFTAHLHPSLVNGLACGKDGESWASRLFGDGILWIPAYRPGYLLAKLCSRKIHERLRNGSAPGTIILQNHGIFVSADSTEEIDSALEATMEVIDRNAPIKPEHAAAFLGEERVEAAREAIAGISRGTVLYAADSDILGMLENAESFLPLASPFTPDHIVYCGARFLYVESECEIDEKYSEFTEENGREPRVICIRDLGAYFTGNERQARNAMELFTDAADIAVYSRNFGGPLHMAGDLVDFIVNWEAESYRRKIA